MYHNLGSKLDRAIRAYLINAGACTTDDIFTANSSAVKPLPCIIVNSHTGQPDPLNIGNYLVDVRIEIKFGAALEEGQTNIEAERKQG
jgi:hypothetical protein